MQISGLSASNTFSATDVLAIEVNVNGVEKTYKLTGATLAAALASIGSYLTTANVVNYLTSTDPTKVLAAPQGKALNDKIGTLVKKYRTVTTTDSDGDAQALADIRQKVILSVIPIRNAGDGTYSSWFGAIIGGSSSGITLSVKCVNDNNEKLASTKVAMDVYYIEQTFS